MGVYPKEGARPPWPPPRLDPAVDGMSQPRGGCSFGSSRMASNHGILGFPCLMPVFGYVIPLGRILGFVVGRLWATNFVFFAVFDTYIRICVPKPSFRLIRGWMANTMVSWSRNQVPQTPLCGTIISPESDQYPRTLPHHRPIRLSLRSR